MTQRESSEPVTVPRAVLKGIEAIRTSGRTNMLDVLRVIDLADAMGQHETVLWIHDNPGLYARAVFSGMRAEPSADDGAEGDCDA